MVLLTVVVISILGALLGKYLFKKWINHLTIYSIIWGTIIFLYELKLLPYIDIIPLAWFYIISAFLSLLLGIFTVVSARNLFTQKHTLKHRSKISMTIFSDKGKSVRYSILLFGGIGLFAAIQNWIVLIEMFGSIPAVFLNANLVYKLNVQKEIKGVIPYISISGYVAIFFAGIYTAYKGKFSFLTFFPFIGIIIKELASFGRAGMLLGLLEFFFAFFLFRNLLKDDSEHTFKFSKTNGVVATSALILFLIISASFAKVSRGAGEKFSGTSHQLKQLEGNLILTPSIYLYFSSHLGVLSKYTNFRGENTGIGQNTFLPVYNILSKIDVVKKPSDFQRGYFIPMWSNTGTYIRELHADFGIWGVLLGPYLLGLLTTWLWFKFYSGSNLFVFTFLVYLHIIIGFSFLVMVTRLVNWTYSLIIILICIPILEKIALKFSRKSISQN